METEKKIRTPREKAEIVEKTISEIRKSNNLSKDLISRICNKNDINEKHIMSVASWRKEELRR